MQARNFGWVIWKTQQGKNEPEWVFRFNNMISYMVVLMVEPGEVKPAKIIMTSASGEGARSSIPQNHALLFVMNLTEMLKVL